jgi:hypothetical protein
MISFLPEAGTTGPAATASLTDGFFKFDATNGPVAGKYRVLVVEDLGEKYKGASLAEPQASAAAATTGHDSSAAEAEWSFDAEVSVDDFEFDFEISDGRATE